MGALDSAIVFMCSLHISPDSNSYGVLTSNNNELAVRVVETDGAYAGIIFFFIGMGNGMA